MKEHALMVLEDAMKYHNLLRCRMENIIDDLVNLGVDNDDPTINKSLKGIFHAIENLAIMLSATGNVLNPHGFSYTIVEDDLIEKMNDETRESAIMLFSVEEQMEDDEECALYDAERGREWMG